MNPEHREMVRDFRRILEATGVCDLLAAYGTDEERAHVIRFDLPLIPEPLRTIAQLFLLGAEVDASAVDSFLSREILAGLEDLRLLRSHNDRLSTGSLRLVSHFGLLIFCEQRSATARLYYGNDSLALGRLLLPVQGCALDLCTGVGTQAILCAQTAAAVTAVEIEPESQHLFWINGALNFVEGKLEFLVGDLFEPVLDRKFDRICCNPPLLPVPPDVAFPRHADGGPDGLAIVRRVLVQLPLALAKDGRCQIIGTVLGNEAGPFLEVFESIAQTRELQIVLVLPCREELSPEGPMLQAIVTTASACNRADPTQSFLAHFNSMRATHIYSFLLCATHSSPGRVRVTRHYQRNSSFWSV